MKERLLDAAMDLIWENSYGATSVDAICDRAGAKKIMMKTCRATIRRPPKYPDLHLAISRNASSNPPRRNNVFAGFPIGPIRGEWSELEMIWSSGVSGHRSENATFLQEYRMSNGLSP